MAEPDLGKLPQAPRSKSAELNWQSPEPAPEPVANDERMQGFLSYVRQASLSRNTSGSYQFRVTGLFVVMLLVAVTMNVVRQYQPETVLTAYLFLAAWAPLAALIAVCWLPKVTFPVVAAAIVLTVFVGFVAPVLMFGRQVTLSFPCVFAWWIILAMAFAWGYAAKP